MTRQKRKINVDKLTEKQLETAEKKIAAHINQAMNLLTEKWNPQLNQFGIETELQITIQQEGDLEIIKKTSGDFFSQYKDDPDLGAIAQELDSITRYLVIDLNNAVEHCNELLSRYGMACDMTFVSKD